MSELVNRYYNQNYINYNSIVLGSKDPIMLIEALILSLLKLIVIKDRTNVITVEMINSQIKMQYILEKYAMRNNIAKFNKRWEKLKNLIEHL